MSSAKYLDGLGEPVNTSRTQVSVSGAESDHPPRIYLYMSDPRGSLQSRVIVPCPESYEVSLINILKALAIQHNLGCC